jgi:hypothetical protein
VPSPYTEKEDDVQMNATITAISLTVVLALGAVPRLRASDIPEIRIAGGSPIRPGRELRLSVPAPHAAGAHYVWEATAGHFEGQTDRSSAIFIAPISGQAIITCVEVVAGARRTYNRTLAVSHSPRAGIAGRRQQPSLNPGAVLPYDIVDGGFVPSGWMGEGENPKTPALKFLTSADAPVGARSSRRWTYTPLKGGAGWVAVAYQYPERNWGAKPGRDLSGKGYRELSVWARGVLDKRGNYPKIQFKAGGNTDPSLKYQASFEAEGEFVELSGEWKRYTVSLAGKNLSNVVSAATFVLRADDHPLGADLFIAQIDYR